MKTTFLYEYPVHAIKHYTFNWTIFFTYDWFWFGTPESYMIKQFMHLSFFII